ncbi:hypothetical protein [Ponticoccus alexandrii]|uniref:Integrase catalytic domain-containing protein n=1 Tax=Ponticoccus alexandrii TaxID=1943633 RepID=A0ABX7F5F9_9RHOB|nr:hypothetical protein [Ponticoccus alexandrii]QRF65537.1 hypothetical protein GQA70_03910 [Ponticoccus alexandrii]
MTTAPRYNFPPGSEVSLLHRPMVVTGTTDVGYSMVCLEDGVETVVTFARLVEYLKLPGARIDAAPTATSDRPNLRLGGYTSVEALPNSQQRAQARFHAAMCEATDIYVALQQEKDAAYKASGRALNKDHARAFIAQQMTLLLGESVRTNPLRGGGKTTGWILYKGRTIMDYYNRFKALQEDEGISGVGSEGGGVREALAPLWHDRGNRKPRLCPRLRELMTEAWERIGLDTKKPGVSNVLDLLQTLIHQENEVRTLNDLPELIVPAAKSLARHRDMLLTPTELMIATEGMRETKRKRGRGSTDVRALMIGELCGMDEQKFSMVAAAKLKGFWHTLSQDEKDAYEAADKYIRKRLHILILVDVASRMPLAWIIAENPNAEATLALLRMATRDKTREERRYGCMNEAARGCGIHFLRNDNGTGLRNVPVIKALMGMGTINGITRTYSPKDRAHDERLFGTLESRFFKVMAGYTGRRPGDIPGYDAIKNGVVDVELLYGMLTRYLVDEYPFERNYGVGMGGRRPRDVYDAINAARGQVRMSDPNTRRIHLGWEASTTPTDDGVRVFEGIWFNSDRLQHARETNRFKGKVKVFVDPDDLKFATVLMPGEPDPIEVHLQMTVFADMTLGEVLQLMAEYRREEPEVTEIYHDCLMAVKMRRFEDISSIGVEHELPRSYTTVEECKAMAKVVFAGARMARSRTLAGTTAPDAITSLGKDATAFKIGAGATVIDGVANAEPAAPFDDPGSHSAETGSEERLASPVDTDNAAAPAGKAPAVQKPAKLARPTNIKELK